jgi:hypothetical protein
MSTQKPGSCSRARCPASRIPTSSSPVKLPPPTPTLSASATRRTSSPASRRCRRTCSSTSPSPASPASPTASTDSSSRPITSPSSAWRHSAAVCSAPTWTKPAALQPSSSAIATGAAASTRTGTPSAGPSVSTDRTRPSSASHPRNSTVHSPPAPLSYSCPSPFPQPSLRNWAMTHLTTPASSPSSSSCALLPALASTPPSPPSTESLAAWTKTIPSHRLRPTKRNALS